MTTAKEKSVRFEHKYSATSVDKAIASSTRAGRRIGGKERKLIHALLKGRTGTNKNPKRKRRTRTKLTKRDVDLLLLASGQLHEDEVSGAAPSNNDWDKLHKRGLIRQDKYSHFPNGLTKKGFNAINRKIVLGNPHKKRKQSKRLTLRKLGARKNPGRFVICATIARHGKDWYFRRSTESFVDNIKDATKYQSASHAWSVAQSIKDQLPRAIKSIKVDEI